MRNASAAGGIQAFSEFQKKAFKERGEKAVGAFKEGSSAP
jgi:hypothetical protein